MSEVTYEERDETGILRTDADGEWLSTTAVAVLDDWI